MCIRDSLCTVEEVCAATTARLQVELKDPAVAPLLPGFLDAHPGAAERIYLTSFLADALAAVRELLPEIPRGMIVHGLPVEETHPEGLDALLERTGATSLHCGRKCLTREDVETQQAQGRRVHVWTVRTAQQMAEALELGVDGATVNDPQGAFEWYAQALAERG